MTGKRRGYRHRKRRRMERGYAGQETRNWQQLGKVTAMGMGMSRSLALNLILISPEWLSLFPCPFVVLLLSSRVFLFSDFFLLLCLPCSFWCFCFFFYCQPTQQTNAKQRPTTSHRELCIISPLCAFFLLGYSGNWIIFLYIYIFQDSRFK